ncbi:hypothetical protein ACFWNT_42250 [Streptomyces sp. NPDC058409]|uniref:hypothetical protein n=1 Tax=Streptomyces sp. NPDC058409 TaxID=3346484 RepID=UPI0036518BB2
MIDLHDQQSGQQDGGERVVRLSIQRRPQPLLSGPRRFEVGKFLRLLGNVEGNQAQQSAELSRGIGVTGLGSGSKGGSFRFRTGHGAGRYSPAVTLPLWRTDQAPARSNVITSRGRP